LASNKLLVYSQDLGGAKFIGPVLKLLEQQDQLPEAVVLVHPLSERYFRKVGIAHTKLADTVAEPPLSLDKWLIFLRSQRIQRIFCTTSSPYLDQTNCHLIVAANDLGVPTLGILDHWKGFDRFFSNGELLYLPYHILCIDEMCKHKLEGIGVSSQQVHVVGHPHLESICIEHQNETTPTKTIRLLLVSQPITADKRFKGIFFHSLGEDRLIDQIAGIIPKISSDQNRKIQMKIRLHPKESSSESIPYNIKLDDGRDWEQAIKMNEIFIGFDSMALVEAQLSGNYCISLGIPELSILSDNSITLSFARKINNISELPSALNEAIESLMHKKDLERKYPEFLKDSTKRAAEVFDHFSRGVLS